MMIDTDYVVDHSSEEETLQDKNLKIEKSYKIMKVKEDNKSRLAKNYDNPILVNCLK